MKRQTRRLIPLKQMAGLAFGGDLLKNSHAKVARPFSPRAAIHVVMRARKPFTLLKRGRRERIAKFVTKFAKVNHVHVHRFANSGNHLHMLIECRERPLFNSFIRALSGTIARMVKLEDSSGASENLWVQRPWTRLVATKGRAFTKAWRYVDLNEIEGGCWGITRRDARIIQEQEIGRYGIGAAE